MSNYVVEWGTGRRTELRVFDSEREANKFAQELRDGGLTPTIWRM